MDAIWQFLDQHLGIWAAAGALTSLGTLVIVGISAKAALGQLGEARQLRLAETRPFVVIAFDMERAETIIYLTIINTGPVIAHNVKFAIDPPFTTGLDTNLSMKTTDLKLFTEGIPSLAPNSPISFLFNSWLQRGDGLHADRYEVQITYDGLEGRSYEDKIILDLGVYRDMRNVSRNGLHEIHAELKSISESLKSFKADFWGGVRVMTPDDLKREQEEKDRRAMEWAKEQRAKRSDEDRGQTSPSEDDPV